MARADWRCAGLVAMLIAGMPVRSLLAQERRTFELPGFSVAVHLSPRAERKIRSGRESVVVAASYFGKANQTGLDKELADASGEIRLAPVQQIEIEGSGLADFRAAEFARDTAGYIEKQHITVSIDVYSARHVWARNVLSCTPFAGNIYAAAIYGIRIDCDLAALAPPSQQTSAPRPGWPAS